MSKKRSFAWLYAAYGAMFGLLFPLIATVVDLLIQQVPWTLSSVQQIQIGNPLLWIIDTAPFFLGLFASFAGRQQDRLIRLNQELAQQGQEREQSLIEVQSLRASLEQQVADRTAGLATAVEVGRAAASILQVDTLVTRVVDLVQERFDLYYAGLFLLNAAGDRAVLYAGTGEAGRMMKEAGHSLEVGGQSMVGAACAQRQARIALDVGEERVRFDNPLLPRTRSEMALPLIVGERVLGALDVQSVEPAAFSEQDVAVLQLVADQVAVAVDNAHKFSQEATLLEATNPIFRVGRRLTAAATTKEVVQAIVDAVAETEADGCAVARLTLSPAGDMETTTILGHWDRRGASGFPIGVSLAPSSAPLSLKPATEFWVVEDILQELDLSEAARRALSRSGSRAFANIPLQSGSKAIGYVNVQRARPGPFSAVSLRLYQTLADQAVAALERTRLLEEAQRRAAREQLIGEVAARMRETLDVETVLATAVSEIGRSLGLAALEVRLGTGADGGAGK
jgi:GAF domain-containing protein